MTYLIKTANLNNNEYNYSITNELPSTLEFSKVYQYSSVKEAKKAILEEKVFNLLYTPVLAVLLVFKKLFK